MFAKTIFGLLALALCSNAELILEVTPEFLVPEVTPFFSLRCSLVEFEEGRVTSLSISRVITPATLTTKAVTEGIALIGNLNPTLPVLSATFPEASAVGQIPTYQSEFGAFLEVILPNPSVEVLGSYQCDAVVSSFGINTPLVAKAVVTTSNPTMDSLLKKVYGLETVVVSLNGTVIDLQGQIDNLTAREDQREADKQAEGVSTTEPTTTEATTSNPSEVTAEFTQKLDDVVTKMNEFNESLVLIDQRLAVLELGGNKTEA